MECESIWCRINLGRTRTWLLECMLHVWRTHGPSPKKTKITLVFYLPFAALPILFVDKKMQKVSQVATQGFWAKLNFRHCEHHVCIFLWTCLSIDRASKKSFHLMTKREFSLLPQLHILRLAKFKEMGQCERKQTFQIMGWEAWSPTKAHACLG